MRHVFISDLVKELLGPRNGATEEFPLTDEPRNEYSTGQLIPPNTILEREPDEEDTLGLGPYNDDEETEDSSASSVNQAFIDAGQNFRRVPSSMGLSFVLDHEPHDGDISVCVTWARYQRVNHETERWIRVPNYWIIDFSNRTSIHRRSTNDPLLLSFKVTPLKNGTSKVSIFIQSAVEFEGSTNRRPLTEEIIFQPEIRVILKNKNWLRELGELSFASEDDEWRVSTRQYDNLKVYARGHLCGAYWHEIDPQRPYEGQMSSVSLSARESETKIWYN